MPGLSLFTFLVVQKLLPLFFVTRCSDNFYSFLPWWRLTLKERRLKESPHRIEYGSWFVSCGRLSSWPILEIWEERKLRSTKRKRKILQMYWGVVWISLEKHSAREGTADRQNKHRSNLILVNKWVYFGCIWQGVTYRSVDAPKAVASSWVMTKVTSLERPMQHRLTSWPESLFSLATATLYHLGRGLVILLGFRSFLSPVSLFASCADWFFVNLTQTQTYPGRGNVKWENASLRQVRRQAYKGIFWLICEMRLM